MRHIRIYSWIVVLFCVAVTPVFSNDKDAEESRGRFLKRFDTNGDGKVTKEESRAVLAKEAKQGALKRKADDSRRRFLKRFDTNRDGKVTKEESRAVLAKGAENRKKAKR